ncbi:hypothetical protein [Xanthomonas bromi]|nr:hypothetical protein [Xanthomonas bromi]
MRIRHIGPFNTVQENIFRFYQARIISKSLKTLGSLILTTSLCLTATTSVAQDFEIGKIPALPGDLNPQLDGYNAGCKILNCGGQGNGMHQGQPASIVILRWTWPNEPELQP